MSVTVTQIWNRFVEETQIGFHGTGTFAATTLTDTVQLQNTNYQGNELRGWWLGYLDSTTASDRAKPIKSNGLVGSTGVLTHAGLNITGTGSAKNYSITRPDWNPVRYGIPLINRSLEMAWRWERAPLTIIANGDGEAAAVGGSDTSATVTRNTTAAYVFNGLASIRVANSGANGYHQYAGFDAAAGRSFTLGIFCRIAVGTAQVQVLTSGGTVIVETTVAGVGQWHYIQLSGTFPSDCYSALLRVGGTGATADTYWDDACLYWEPATRISGPSWVTQWRDERGQPAFRLLRMVNRLTGDGSAAGKAYDWRLVDPQDYQIVNIPSAANKVEFELSAKLTRAAYGPIYIEARRPYSDDGTVDDGADTTECPIRLVTAGMKRLAANDRNSPHADVKFGGDGAYEAQWLQEQAKAASHLTLPALGERGMAWQELR